MSSFGQRQDRKSTTQPLQGLRVLDFGHYISGPLAGVFLADQGADVINVVRTDANDWRSATPDTLSRGKRVLALDLKSPQGILQALELASNCDVLIENFRPGVMDRLGLGYEKLQQKNPGIVYISMPGFSRHDSRAHERAWDSTISAACGLFTDSAMAGAAFNLPPTHTELPLPSVYAGLWGALAAVSSVYGRLLHGRGDHVEVTLMDAAMSSAAGVISAIEDQPARYNIPPIARWMIESISLQRIPNIVASFVHSTVSKQMPPFFRNYRCKDGGLLFLCLVDNEAQINKLLEATGLKEAIYDIGFVQGNVLDVPPSKNNINAYRGPASNWRKLRKRLEKVFASDTADVWANRLQIAGVPAARQCSTAEWVNMPQMLDQGIVIRDRDVNGRDLYSPGPQVDVRGSDTETAMPLRGRVLDAAWAETRAFQPRSLSPQTEYRGQPLAGVKVIDLANVIAGPAAGRTLAELGAEVLHVSAVEPKMGPRQTLVFGLEVQQGKRDLACDLHDPDGQDLLHRHLIPSADVLLYNKTPEQATRLGVSPAQIHAINPQTIVTAVTAFSGIVPGGWEDRPGYDPILQALGGIMRRYGGAESPMVHGVASCIDYFTGFSAAFGAVIGLLARSQGNSNLIVRTSLARSTGWIQLPFMASPASHRTTKGMLERGPNPLDYIYKTKDGWVHLAAQLHQLNYIHGILSEIMPGDLMQFMPRFAGKIRRMYSRDVLSWVAGLGITGQLVMSARQLRKYAVKGRSANSPIDSNLPSGRVVIVDHPSNERFFMPDALWLRPSQGRPQLAPAAAPGQHTRQILSEFELADDVVDGLFERGVVADRWLVGARYVPD
jgi:crotonobetainyl-CoA:carnitine CoA-transferase CaiB-like acyl-CoA transferase